MLTDTCRHYATARRRLAEAEPGYPAHTPGAGEPGRGKGYTAGSITERLVIPGDRAKVARRETVRHPELEAQHRLDRCPHAISTIAGLIIANPLHLPWPTETRSPRWNIQQLAWTRWLIRQALTTGLDVHQGLLGQLHNNIAELHRTVMTWSTNPKPATHPSMRDQLADDLTGMWCTSCLRIGVKNPRRREERCGWCDDFKRKFGFMPPPELLEMHSRGTVNMRDIEPFIKAHRERTKQKRKRANAR